MNEAFILSLLEKFDTSSVKELEIQKDGTKISLSKNDRAIQSQAPVQFAPTATSQAAASPVATKNTAEAASKKKAAASSKLSDALTIKSPIVGTFYRSPSPDSPAYVEKGKKVKKGDVICILEAMKMMNSLEAEFDCIIEDILVTNGELVEFDQDLFTVKKI
ncbi:MAG TPA: acetyl-CoA carboxylase biotin carboxyl carrier protein [Treponemataceae bacterium]|nr:acetyl-CoA carboxylase biotin carboxyl carrier protein [Treponemataceae bacterium]